MDRQREWDIGGKITWCAEVGLGITKASGAVGSNFGVMTCTFGMVEMSDAPFCDRSGFVNALNWPETETDIIIVKYGN
jgi:hypothetical protein